MRYDKGTRDNFVYPLIVGLICAIVSGVITYAVQDKKEDSMVKAMASHFESVDENIELERALELAYKENEELKKELELPSKAATDKKIYYPEESLYCEPHECYAYCFETSVQDYVKMRCGPDKNNYDIAVNRIENNTKVTVLSDDLSGWKLCSYENNKGWIRSDFLFDNPQ